MHQPKQIQNNWELVKDDDIRKMSEEVPLCLSDPIEEPVRRFRGEGSGAECTVGNGEEKKKIFFFGQPGCLKHSPIKTSPNDDQNNHKEVVEGSSGAAFGILGNHKKAAEAAVAKKIMDDDENGDTLLQQITDVLGDEPDAGANHVQSKNYTDAMFMTKGTLIIF